MSGHIFLKTAAMVLLFVLASVVHAAVVHTAGDAAAGKVQVTACVACHGQDGATGLDGSYPNLAGQHEKYLLRQLQAIQSGDRAVLLMAGQLTNKTEQNLADMAAYYASLPAKSSQAVGEDEQVAMAQQIYRGGIARKDVAACTACHNPSGTGNAAAGFPHLAGQPAQYTTVQLKAYRENQRVTDATYGGMMRDIAEGLTDTEIGALADYIQGLR